MLFPEARPYKSIHNWVTSGLPVDPVLLDA